MWPQTRRDMGQLPQNQGWPEGHRELHQVRGERRRACTSTPLLCSQREEDHPRCSKGLFQNPFLRLLLPQQQPASIPPRFPSLPDCACLPQRRLWSPLWAPAAPLSAGGDHSRGSAATLPSSTGPVSPKLALTSDSLSCSSSRYLLSCDACWQNSGATRGTSACPACRKGPHSSLGPPGSQRLRASLARGAHQNSSGAAIRLAPPVQVGHRESNETTLIRKPQALDSLTICFSSLFQRLVNLSFRRMLHKYEKKVALRGSQSLACPGSRDLAVKTEF